MTSGNPTTPNARKPTAPKAQIPTTPKSTTKKRRAPTDPPVHNQDTRFAWACFKSTGQNIDYEEVARLCGCTPTAARFRFYKMRDAFQDPESLKGEPEVKDGPREKIPRTTSPAKTTPSKKASLKKEALEALKSLEDLPSELDLQLVEKEDMYSDVDVQLEEIDALFDEMEKNKMEKNM